MKRPKFLCSDFFIDIILPNRCPVCSRVIAWDKLFCDECIPEEKDIVEAPLLSCDKVTALYPYEGNARNAILFLKDNRHKRLAEHYAYRLSILLAEDNVDLVTCVPMNFYKRMMRGYDQADVIAKSLAKCLNKPYDHSIMRHSFSLKAQHSRNAEQRRSAAGTTYSLSKKAVDLSGKTVLLCDDVITTGSTVDACAKLLKQLGAERVIAAAVCRTQ